MEKKKMTLKEVMASIEPCIKYKGEENIKEEEKKEEELCGQMVS